MSEEQEPKPPKRITTAVDGRLPPEVLARFAEKQAARKAKEQQEQAPVQAGEDD